MSNQRAVEPGWLIASVAAAIPVLGALLFLVLALVDLALVVFLLAFFVVFLLFGAVAALIFGGGVLRTLAAFGVSSSVQAHTPLMSAQASPVLAVP